MPCLPRRLVGLKKGASAYSAVEHVALLSIISKIPEAFNASESSPKWGQCTRG